MKIGCIEEVGYRMNYITREQLQKHAESLSKSGYGEYLKEVIRKEKLSCFERPQFHKGRQILNDE